MQEDNEALATITRMVTIARSTIASDTTTTPFLLDEGDGHTSRTTREYTRLQHVDRDRNGSIV
ncbi:hypothetical protein COLSTE_02393 [Collinsella stercoris DSM 13279]|uniref:Uncharacterized protein n=1 Tax=Collinsella stercoris DSM 13279 TaxID=445975 RepID=B6GE56_9ACTN|nr:hypothetical protein COLSTE_02393 [Collinsella stercoris DSM 13279]